MVIEIISIVVSFTLAIVAISSLQMLRKQVILARAQQAPFLQIKEVKFKGNELQLKLRNIGQGAATQIGVVTEIYPALPEFEDETGKKLTKEEVEELRKKQSKRILVRFVWLPIEWLNYKEERIYPSKMVTFLKAKDEGPSYLVSTNKFQTFKCNPKFGFKYKNSKKEGTSGRRVGRQFDYPELRKVLLANGIRFLAIEFELLYKDQAEFVQLPRSVIKCVSSLEKHETLEDAVKAGHSFYFVPLLQDEIECKVGYLPEEYYRTLKTRLSFPEEWE